MRLRRSQPIDQKNNYIDWLFAFLSFEPGMIAATIQMDLKRNRVTVQIW
jgi:hypothetical protein